jgi:type II secretory pathway pseudopilin PulG
MSRRRQQRAEGFTIVEMLVVIGVLGLLIGLLLPALSGARKKSEKLRELNALKQVDLAWRLYANSSADRALPGFLTSGPPDNDVQYRWGVSFEYRNRMVMPHDTSAPWTWRLLPFMDYSYEMVQGHVDELRTEGLDIVDSGQNPSAAELTGAKIAYFPGFGYNAFYVGGWWEMVSVGNARIPRYRFHDATVNGAPKVLVSTSIGQIRRSSEVITFCSSALLEPNTTHRSWRRDLRGFHCVSPPMLGPDEQWSAGGEVTIIGDLPIDGFSGTAAPIGRYNKLAAVLHADGHTSVETPGALLDMRRWIDAANDDDFTHD